MRIKIAAKIENHFLLECVVEQNPQRIKNVLNNESRGCQQNQRSQFFRMM